MFRNKLTAFAVAALLSITTAACGSDSNGPSAPRNGTITMLNESDAPIDAVYISSCSDDSWGADRLPAGETIATGATRNFTMPAGCYDIKANIGTLAGIWWDRDLEAGGVLQFALDVVVSNVGPVQPAIAGAESNLKTR